MDVWASHAKRRRNCKDCTKPINPGDRVMVGQWKRTFPWGTRTKRVMSHFACWVGQAEAYLDDHPYEPSITPGPGRPQQYTATERTRRMALGTNIRRWTEKQQHYTGDGMWAVANTYKDKIVKARVELNEM